MGVDVNVGVGVGVGAGMLYRRLNLIVVRGRGGRERRGGDLGEGRQGRVVSVVAS